MLLALSPLSFFFTAVYTESLFLALSLGAYTRGAEGGGPRRCVYAGLAAVTRVPGVLLVVPLALIYLKQHRRPGWRLGWLALASGGARGLPRLPRGQGYGALAPLVQQTGAQHQHRMAGPIETILAAVGSACAGVRTLDLGRIYRPTLGGPLPSGAESILLLAVLVVAVIVLVAAFRRLPLAYGAYACAALLVSTWSPVAGQPLKSVDRYTLTIFPLWMVAGAWISERRLTRATLLVSAGLLAFWTFQFATWSWVA